MVCDQCVARGQFFGRLRLLIAWLWSRYFVCNDAAAIAAETAVPCGISELPTVLQWWAAVLAMVVFCIVIELALLWFTALQCACKIACEYKYRLVPMNANRVFIADALVRTCFEIGQPSLVIAFSAASRTQAAAHY